MVFQSITIIKLGVCVQPRSRRWFPLVAQAVLLHLMTPPTTLSTDPLLHSVSGLEHRSLRTLKTFKFVVHILEMCDPVRVFHNI